MTQVLAATTALFRDRDLFIHDGTKLRRFRISAPVQAVLFVILLGLVAWASYATARLITRPQRSALAAAHRSAHAHARAAPGADRSCAHRQQDRSGDDPGRRDQRPPRQRRPARPRRAAAAPAGRARRQGARRPLSGHRRRAEEARHQPGRRRQQAGVGGPFESTGNPTFKALFNSWKKLDQLQDDVIAIPSDKPVKAEVTFTSGFGVRDDPFHARRRDAPGHRPRRAYGTPIYATADGTVLRAGWNSGGYGNLVELDHGRGIITRYGHMSAILVHAGEHVTRGQQIGRMGSTGRSTGNHLHYEVRIDGRAGQSDPVHEVDRLRARHAEARRRRRRWTRLASAARGGSTERCLAAARGAPYLRSRERATSA